MDYSTEYKVKVQENFSIISDHLNIINIIMVLIEFLFFILNINKKKNENEILIYIIVFS
jgi:hypothetical protein